MAKPGRHPLPTAAFRRHALSIIRVPKSHCWYRLYPGIHNPLHFSMSKAGRFDAPDRSYGVLYIARQLSGAFVETLCRNAGATRPIPATAMDTYNVVEIRTSRLLRLVDLAGKGLARMGLDSRLSTGDYRVAQRWSEAFHRHADHVDGIIYPARHAPRQQAAALFDRAGELLTVKPCGTLRNYMGEQEFFALLDHYGVALV